MDAEDRRWRRGRAVEFAYNLSLHSTTGLAPFQSLYGEGRHPARIVYSGNVKPKPGGGTPAVRAGRCCCHQNNSRYAASILSSSRNLLAPFKVAAWRGVNTVELSIPRRSQFSPIDTVVNVSQFSLIDTVVNVNRLRL